MTTLLLDLVSYFSDLYTPKQEQNFDNDHKVLVEEAISHMVTESFQNHDDILDGEITLCEVTDVVKSLKKKKSMGFDLISNEHILFGGDHSLAFHLVELYNLYLVAEHIPKETKKGIIVTIPKTGKKNTSLRENNRGITLLTTLYKIFEKLMLNRIMISAKVRKLDICHPLQSAYQKQMCCLMSSFILQEATYHYIERKSKVFCCLLDASAAFDSVWQDGLFFKLYNIGINSKIWRVLRSAYNDVHSCVMYDGLISRWFNVQQSVRQGGVLSPWLYIIYINDLANELQSRNIGAHISETFYGSPIQADDVAVTALTKSDLDQMMNVCYTYTTKWRYRLNPIKSVVLVFGETNHQNECLKTKRVWKLNNDVVNEKQYHRHVGILLASNFVTNERTLQACQKVRGSFFSLIGSGVHPTTMNPLTSKKIYLTICLPRGLFGCELWNDLTLTEMKMLEVTHRFCVKYMQGLHRRTHTNICLAMLGLSNIEVFIDKRKLLFLHRLCMAPGHSRVKQLFLQRLSEFFVTPVQVNKGFIKDIYRILDKYKLVEYIQNLFSTGTFPSKAAWKSIINKNIKKHYENEYLLGISNDSSCVRFAQLHEQCSIPSVVWQTALENPSVLKQCALLGKLSSFNYECNLGQICRLCGVTFKEKLEHFFCSCQAVYRQREFFWNRISNHFPIELEVELYNVCDFDFVCMILGKSPLCLKDDAILHKKFIETCAKCWFFLSDIVFR